MLRIAANARRLKLRHDIKLVVIDYLQLIEPDNRRDSRQEQVAQISRRLKFLARELKIPVIALAQVNRSSEDRAGPPAAPGGPARIGTHRARRRHRHAAAPARCTSRASTRASIEVIVAKQRNGPTGEITLTFLKQFMRFENFAVGIAVRRAEPRATRVAYSDSVQSARRQSPPESRRMRVGIGHDTHRLAEGRPLMLGGVRIEHARGLVGHSDADVVLHALTDALLGAAGLGDIGDAYPDTDPA